MSHRIALNFEDGVTRFISVTADETVADAAYRQGLNIPLDCRDGACGACKCLAESGQYDLGHDYIDEALSASEAAAGYVLTCQMRVSSDGVIRVPATASMCRTRPSRLDVSLAEVRALSSSTFALRLQDAALTDLAFLPGQYVNLGIPGTTQHRAYSFSSLPDQGQIEFLIRNVPGGLMSGYLSRSAQAGDRLTLDGPLGSFYLRTMQRPVLMLAGGTGLAPFLAMLAHLQRTGTAHPIHLIYGVTHDTDLVALEQLELLQATLPGFTWRACVASPESSYPHRGFVTHHLGAEHLHAGDCDIYLCGPPPMVEAVQQHLQALGVTPANLYYEKFAPSA